jgi:hypothetical protein
VTEIDVLGQRSRGKHIPAVAEQMLLTERAGGAEVDAPPQARHQELSPRSANPHHRSRVTHRESRIA